jgi:hypothetical protein
MRPFNEDRRKLKELILYVSQQCATKHNFGSVILYKILYFSDHFAYGKLGQPITGAEYIKEKHGPIPRTGIRAIQELADEGRLRVDAVRHGKGTLKKPVALNGPDMSMFSPAEMSLIDSVIERFQEATTRKARSVSHQLKAWRAYEFGEIIPYETVYVSPNQRLTRKEVKIGQEIARRRGWLTTVR